MMLIHVELLSTVPECFSAVSLQAKPIYGGWLLLAPEGTDFDNPVHRSRVSEAETSPPRDMGGGGRRSSKGLSLPMGVAVTLGVPQAPPCTHPLVQTRKLGDVSCSEAGMPSLGYKVSHAGQQPEALQVRVRLSLCNFIACCFYFLMF